MTRMLLIVLASVLVAAGCTSVYIPNTPEGQACKRECMMVRNTCNASCPRGTDCGMSCTLQQKDCWRSCPGATEH